MSHHHEVERTYSPPTGDTHLAVPDLVGTGPVAVLGRRETAELEAVYVDTVDLRLVRAGISLRRRVGGSDEGWHLKLPAGDGRDEVHAPLDASHDAATVPSELLDLVLAWTAGADVAPVADITTRRTTHTLVGSDGDVLAEVADDETSAVREGVVLVWREVEVELVDGDVDLLDDVEAALLAAGFTPSEVTRKIERALGDVLPAPEVPAKVGRKRPASRVLHARLVEQLAELRSCESEVRRDRPDAVHRARVAARRLRSALRTYGPLLEDDTVETLQRGLQRFTRALGPERDSEVAAERVGQALDDAHPELVVDGVRARVRTEVAARMAEHREATLAELGSPAHLTLLVGLDRLVADPPWTPLASQRADDVLPDLLAKDRRRLEKRMTAAEDDEGRHRARSAAKRLRYAAETLAPAYGRDAERVAATAKDLTQPLGVLQDTRLSTALLWQIGEAATRAGESSFVFGHLHALEEAAAVEARELTDARWRRASKRRSGRDLRL